MFAIPPSDPALDADVDGQGCAEPRPTLGRYLTRSLPEDLFWCLGIAIFLTLLMGPFLREHSAWYQIFALNAIISTAIGLSVTNAYRFLMPALRRRLRGAVGNAFAHLLIAVGSTAFGVEVAVRSIEATGGMKAADLRPDAFRIGIVIVAVLLGFQLVYERLRRQARRDELRAQEAKKEALRAELRALQARTNPHFLFNSLNTVAGLIEESPAAAERMIERLAALFRYTLRGSEAGWVRLAEEIEAVRSYLEVEAIRLGDRLESEVSVGPEAGEVLVPPLVLQPLVENAVLHGVAPRREGGRVRVEARRTDSSLVLSVADDGDGPGSSPHRGSGTSLVELEKRLELLYGGDAVLASAPVSAGGFEVTLSLPLEAPS